MTRQYLMWMREFGRLIPIYYQEPFRRDFSKGWQPTAEDFLTDLEGAIEGGAAGWCFHNGDNALSSTPFGFSIKAGREPVDKTTI